MLNIVLLAGMVVFAISSVYFTFNGKNRNGFNTAMLVSFITLVSYVLMWQGDYTLTSAGGEAILWTRWIFYGMSCTLLMVEIAKLKSISGGGLTQLIYLTAIVMLTGTLAARDLSTQKWLMFVLSSIAYIFLLVKLLPFNTPQSNWVGKYVFFGWTVFPIVFLLAPTGVGVMGAALANLIYLLLDIFTKILFNLELESKA